MQRKDRPVVTVSNIITGAKIHLPVDLTALLMRTKVDYPESPLARIPISINNTKFSVFPSGSVVSRGSKTILEFESDLLLFHNFLSAYNLELNLEYSVTNIVATSKLQLARLDLFALSRFIPTSSYDSTAVDSDREDVRCDVIVYPLTKTRPRKTILVFSSSAITLTGFRSLPDLINQAAIFKALLVQILSEHPEVKSGEEQ
jgi:TATA-box binding protein (TBP) (component of TFIID and TFIIIB)